MNVLLEKLFEEYGFSEKSRHEIRQMFLFLSDEKKQTLLNQFEGLSQKILKIEQELITEQQILLDSILPDIQHIVQK